MQPLKVFLSATFVAGVIKKVDENVDKLQLGKEAKLLARNEQWLNQANNEISIFNRSSTETLLPPDKNDLSRMLALRYKEKKLKSISHELMT